MFYKLFFISYSNQFFHFLHFILQNDIYTIITPLPLFLFSLFPFPFPLSPFPFPLSPSTGISWNDVPPPCRAFVKKELKKHQGVVSESEVGRIEKRRKEQEGFVLFFIFHFSFFIFHLFQLN